MFPEALFEELLELDRNNMATQFLASGGEFDGTIRRHSLHQEWSDGAEFFLHRREDMLAGYLEVMPVSPGRLTVRSLQINRNFSGAVTLRALLGAALSALDIATVHVVTSSAHSSNTPSRKLHHGLGFEVVGVDNSRHGGARILFQASAEDLRHRLSSLARASTSIHRICNRQL